MRLAIFSSLLFAACASSTPYVQSHPDVARYSTTLEQARVVVHDVLASRSTTVAEVGPGSFATGKECRTVDGSLCQKHNAFTKGSDGAQTYAFQLGARVVATDAGVIVKVGATLVGNGDGKTIEVGSGEVPQWAQQEVDSVQADIRHQLAPLRPTGS